MVRVCQRHASRQPPIVLYRKMGEITTAGSGFSCGLSFFRAIRYNQYNTAKTVRYGGFACRQAERGDGVKTKAIAVGCLLTILFCACSSSAQPLPQSPTTLADFTAKEQPARQTLVWLLEPQTDPLLRAGVESFAEQTARWTDGMLTVELQTSENPAGDYLAGVGDLFYLDGGKYENFSKDLAFLSTPMLYKSADYFTMALNSSQMLEFLRDSLEPLQGVVPLAAFSQPRSCLVAAREGTGWNSTALEKEVELVEDAPPTATLRKDSVIAEWLEGYGFQTTTADRMEERFRRLLSKESAVAEFTMQEIEILNWQNSELAVVHVGHDLSPCWLLMDSERYAVMSAEYQAVIQEAVAHMFPLVDTDRWQREEAALARLREQGISVERMLAAFQSYAGRQMQQEAEENFQHQYMLGIIGEIQ